MEELVPVTEFKWPSWNDIGPAFTLTCKNHLFLRWSTKHPTHRSLHYLGLDPDKFKAEDITKENAHWMFQECPCKWEDLLVIGKEA